MGGTYISAERIADALGKRTATGVPSVMRATVAEVPADGIIRVRLDGSAMGEAAECGAYCGAAAGDRVAVVRLPDGRLIATGRRGGESWDTLAGKPVAFPPTAHTHPDYEAVYGTSGIWNFVKFSNGLAICWCKATTFNSGTWERWNSMSWYSANSWQANYPFSFIEIPFEKVEMTADSMAIHGFQSSSTQNASKTKTSIYKPMREGTASACTVTVRCLAAGRWK